MPRKCSLGECLPFPQGNNSIPSTLSTFPPNATGETSHTKSGSHTPLIYIALNSCKNKIWTIFIKGFWQADLVSKIEDVQTGLKALVAEVKQLGITSIAIPALGCGNGGLDWLEVKPLIESAFAELPEVKAIVFEPADA